MKNLIITILLFIYPILLSQAQIKSFRAIGYAGKDTTFISMATINAKGELTLQPGNYRGAIQLIPVNQYLENIRKHLSAIPNIRTQAAFESAKTYVSDTLSFDILYTSGLWKEYIQQWVGFYANTSPNPSVFSDAFVPVAKKVIERTIRQNPQIVIRLAKDLIDFFEQYALDNAAEKIAAYSFGLDLKDDKLQYLGMRLITASKIMDNPAPPLTGTENVKIEDFSSKQPTLLLFYESGCEHCNIQIDELKKYYNDLIKKGYRIISLSSDKDEKVFEYYSKDFPWQDKLCDFKGFEGDNFKNYGVASTPTIYTVESNGTISGRYARLSDTGIVKSSK